MTNAGSLHDTALRFSEFRLDWVAFEVRYTHALLLWDRAGALWQDARDKWPDLELISAEPSKTAFRIADTQEMSVELNLAKVISYDEQFPPLRFAETSKLFLALVSSCLEVNVFSRVGVRFMFSKEFADRGAEVSALMKSRVTRPPETGFWGTDGPPCGLDFRVRWEGQAAGVQLRLAHEDRIYEIQRHLGVRMEFPKRQEFHGVVFDVDFFTSAATERGKLDVEALIQQYSQMLKRESDAFFGAEI